MIINCDQKEEYDEAILAIEKVLMKHELVAGVSRSFDSLLTLKTYYDQAQQAYLLGRIMSRENNPFYFYRDLLVYDLFSNLKDTMTLEAFIHPGYEKLLEYDRINHTDYCDTVLEYFLNSNNVTATAKSLFIHRNTMSYRLEKISEITACDFTQGEDIFHLYLSIKLHNWLGVI